MSVLNLLYGKGRDHDYLTYRPERFNLPCSVRIRPIPLCHRFKEEPFLEVCLKREDWAGPVWRTPNNRLVSVVTINEPRVRYTRCGYQLQPELVQWIELNRETLLRYWYRVEGEEAINQLEADIDNLKPLTC